MASDIYDSAIEALKQKLEAQVALAQSSPLKGKKNPDWDPLEHPKDAEGKFTEKHSATFTHGKTKTATYTTPQGKKQVTELAPGEKLHKVPSGSVIKEHADGSMSFVAAKAATYNPPGTVVGPGSVVAGQVKNKNLDTLIAENLPDKTSPISYVAEGKKQVVTLDKGVKLYEVQVSSNSVMHVVEHEDGKMYMAPGYEPQMPVHSTSYLGEKVKAGEAKLLSGGSKPPEEIIDVKVGDASFTVKQDDTGTLFIKTADSAKWAPVPPESLLAKKAKATFKQSKLDAAKAEKQASPAESAPDLHPSLQLDEEDTTVFTHPVSEKTWALKPGQTFYQHKKSLNSFILVDEGGLTGTFFNKHGQAIASNPSTKVWTLKNYNQIWPPSKTTAAATAAAKAEAKAAVDKQQQKWAENQKKLADWEKALLAAGGSEEELGEDFVLTGGKSYKLKSGEKLYVKKDMWDNVYVKEDADGSLYMWESVGKFSDLYKGWWDHNKAGFSLIGGGDGKSQVSVEVTHEPEDGLWGAIQTPANDKVQLKPGDMVWASESSSKGKQIAVMSAAAEGSGTFYTIDGEHPSGATKAFLEGSPLWVKITEVPLPEVSIPEGKSLGAASTADLNVLVKNNKMQLGTLVDLQYAQYSEQWVSAYSSTEVFLDKFSAKKARTLAANTIATLNEFDADKVSFNLKKEREALGLFLQAQELASRLKEQSTDVEDVETRWAHLNPKLKYLDVPYSFPLPMEIRGHLDTAMKEWRFNQKQASLLGFDLASSTITQKHEYMVSQGFSAAGALDEEQSELWIQASLGAPQVISPAKVMKGLESYASYKVHSAQAMMSLKKTLKETPPAPSPSEPDQAVQAQTKAFLAGLKNLALGYGKGESFLSYGGSDQWGLWEAGKKQTVLTTSAVLDKLANESGWEPTSLGTVGGVEVFSYNLEVWEGQHKVKLADADKTTLNKYIKASGGNYVALMKASHKRDWITLHLAGDEVGKWTLEHSLAVKSYGLHKWENSHPGSWGTNDGAAARQALSDFLTTQEWFPDLADQLGEDNPDWSEVYKLPPTAISKAYVVLGLDATYGKMATSTQGKREAVAWWFETRGRLPKPSLKAPEPLVEPPKTTETPAIAPVPPGIDADAWSLVLAAEAGIPEIKKLKFLDTAPFAPHLFSLSPENEFPEGVQHLARWSHPQIGDSFSLALKQAKENVRQAIKARGAQGVWAPPSYVLWEDANGAKHPLKPGSTVHQSSGSSAKFFVLAPDKKSGIVVEPGSTSPLVYPEDLEKAKELPVILKAPKPLTYADTLSADDAVGFSKFEWEAVEEIEAKPAHEVKFPGFSTGGFSPEQITQAVQGNAATPPYTKANAAKLPQGVQKMVVWALAEKNLPILGVIEWKLKHGHYAEFSLSQLLDPSASYYPKIMKGQISVQHMWDEWDESVSTALGDALGVSSSSSYWSKADLQKLHDALIATLVPQPIQLVAPPKTPSGLPVTLNLTPIDKSLGGMHSKQVWVDQLNNEWMSKAFPSDPNAKARVDAEHAAMAIGRLFGTHSPETRTMTLNGSYSYVQYLKPAKGDLSGFGPNDLNDEQLAQAMEEHVLDWLNSNHDSHPMNLLKDPNGKDIIPIDKGQAWRFFGEDQLAVGYLPPSNPIAVWYDQFYYAVQKGQISKEKLDRVTKRVLSKAYKVSSKYDTEVKDLLTQAFSARENLPSGFSTKQKLVDGVMKRKASLLDDFEGFYKKLYSQGGYTWDIDVESLKKTQINKHVHTSVTQQFADDVVKAGVHGKAIFFNTTDVEDAHFTVFTEKTSAGKNLAGQGFLRQEADKAFTSWLKTQFVENESGSSSSLSSYEDSYKVNYASLPNNDHWFSYIVSAAKTVNHHAVDKEYNQNTLQQAKTVQTQMKKVLDQLLAWEKENPEKPFKSSLYEVVTAEQQAAWKSMLIQYIDDVDRIFAAKDDGTKVLPHVSQFSYTPSSGLNTSGKAKVTVRLVNADGQKIDVYDDLNYVMTGADGSKVKLTTNSYKQIIESGNWTVSAPEGKSTKAAEVWKLKGKGDKILVTWTKKPGETVWTSKSGETTEDEVLQKAIQEQPQMWEFEGPEVDDQAQVTVGEKTFKVTKRKSHAPDGQFDYQTGELKVSGKKIGNSGSYYEESGQTGYQYDIEYGDVHIHYRPWTEPGVAMSQQGMLRFRVENWNGSTEQIEDVMDTLRSIGLDLTEADEESLQLFYWRHLTAILQQRADRNSAKWSKITQKAFDNLPPAEELAALKAAWAQAIGQTAVETADWMPKFSRLNMHVTNEDPEFTAGHPYWHRPDVSIKDVKDAWGGKTALSAVGDWQNMADITLSGAMLSTEERHRVLGKWITGMSSSTDQTYGSGSFVFTRQNVPFTQGHVYYHPRVALRTSNYSWNTDHWGELIYRPTEAKFEFSQSAKHTKSNNELMIKNAVSFLDDVAAVVYPNETARQKVIKRFKELGISELHGVPIEQLFVTDFSAAQSAVKKVWDQVLQEVEK